MTPVDNYQVVEAMELHGGSFVRALADACRFADHDNLARIKAAFPELWAAYAEMAREGVAR